VKLLKRVRRKCVRDAHNFITKVGQAFAWGYQLFHLLLRREGCAFGQNKTRRMYCVGPAIAQKRRRGAGSKRTCVMTVASLPGPTRAGAMSFLHLAADHKLPVLNDRRYLTRAFPAWEPRFGSGSGIAGNDLGRPGHRVWVMRSGSGLPAWRLAGR
jgi:hypothetical protein